MSTSQWTADQLADMSGKTVVVTGASSGIGVATASELARAGAHVVLAVRDVAKGESAASTMRGSADVRELDLSSLASIQKFAADWSGDLDVLINNAGIMMVPAGRTADGFEMQIGTNHLGHFALTNLLLPHVTDRVVTVTSDLYKLGKIDLNDLNWERRPYTSLGAYLQSKLANLLFTFELQRRLAEAKSAVRAYSAHPGVAHTNLITHVGGFKGRIGKLFLVPISQDVEHGALPTLFAASQDLPGGSYVGPDGLIHTKGYPEVVKATKGARDPALALRLWDLSAQLTSSNFECPRVA